MLVQAKADIVSGGLHEDVFSAETPEDGHSEKLIFAVVEGRVRSRRHGVYLVTSGGRGIGFDVPRKNYGSTKSQAR